MFVRVVRLMSGHVDGIDLCRFEVGRVYRLPHALAAFVLAIGACEPEESSVEIADSVWKGVWKDVLPSTRPLIHYTGRERRLAAR
jgi:hypothetical protein